MQPQLGFWKRFIPSLLVGGQNQPQLGIWKRFYYKFISGGQMQPQLGIWKSFVRSLSRVERCSLSWGSGRGSLEVYLGWTDVASAGDLEEVY